jgi:hypothetical protein
VAYLLLKVAVVVEKHQVEVGHKVVLVVEVQEELDQEAILVMELNQLNQEIQALMDLVMMQHLEILTLMGVEVLEEAQVLLVLVEDMVEDKVDLVMLTQSPMAQLQFIMQVEVVGAKVLQDNKLVVKVVTVVEDKVEWDQETQELVQQHLVRPIQVVAVVVVLLTKVKVLPVVKE